MVPLLEQVLKNNTGSVKIVHKNFPLNFHKMALPAARAAHAADRQGKFWQYHDSLYKEKNLSQNSINKIADQIGLDLDKFAKDIKSPQINSLITNDIQEARQLGITGTPTVFINGRKLKNRSIQGFQKLIDEELKKRTDTETGKSQND